MPRAKTREEAERDLSEQAQAYRTCFLGAAGQIVQSDLAEFCHANETTFDPDPRMHAFREGQRSVWTKIQRLIGLTPEELFALYARPVIRETPPDA